ncbi:hypothetical protein DFH08DRAFT_326666 [Mycena albidolilacea]|uniref:Uncharacterized protein n=1 Tax=Mycena albidolilacea TaxID=1033008 RepID=A0AAD7F1B5_9AGAR|nr:hypothetical protein DFH08DRAFT_326666 [Mycena albidolilacea]
MNCQFSFGPDRSYFCSAGSVYAWSDNSLPPGLASILGDSAHPHALNIPHDVAFSMQPGTYALCWKTKRGEDRYEEGCLGPSYPRLARFITAAAANGSHTTRTVFGPNASFFSTSPSGFCWQNLPPGLEDNMQSCIRLRRPTCVALGVEGTYVVVYSDGTTAFDLCGQYPLLQTIIMETAPSKRGLAYVALNPFVAGEYYAVYGDGTATWCLLPAWGQDVTTVSLQIKNLLVAPAPGTVTPPPMYAPAAIPMVMQPAQPAQFAHPAQPQPVQAAAVYAPAAILQPAQPAQLAQPAQFAQPVQFSQPVQFAQPAQPAQPAQFAQLAQPQPVQAAAADASKHHITWQEGLVLGLKAADGIGKIAGAFNQFEQGSDQ